MLDDKYKEKDVRAIVCLLPEDQIRHMENVGRLVGVMSKKLYECSIYIEEMNEDINKKYEIAGYYHDIGKVLVPKEILSKPGKLSKKEFEIIREHPLNADKLFDYICDNKIKGIPEQYIHSARETAAYHHEWWNGKGYPFGIAKEEIPLIARITSICDTYDAITSNRAYRQAYTREYACRELEKNAGTQFEPALVRVFLEYEEEIFQLLENNKTKAKSFNTISIA